MAFPEYEEYDGLGLAALVRTRQVQAGELVEAAIARIEAANPALNAVVHTMYDQARADAARGLPEGPFTGVPFLLKDLHVTCAGVPTSCGTRLLRHLPMPHDSEIVRRFRTAGVVILGKTNTPEFGLTPFTESETLGVARNPWDRSRTPGGSSGGSGAAVAARMVPIAGASDGGGSIRIPASCCGVFGLKPTRGRTPLGPDHGELWRGFTIEHVISRSVRDSAAMLDAIAGPDVGAPYHAPPAAGPFQRDAENEPRRLRIAVTSHPFLGHAVDGDCEQALGVTADLLRRLGHDVVEAAPEIEREPCAVAFLTVLTAETRADIEWAAKMTNRRPSHIDFEVGTYAVGLLGRSQTATDYVNAVRVLQSAARRIGAFFETVDVLVTPTLAEPPVRIGALKTTGRRLAFLKAVGRVNAGWLLNAIGAIPALAAKTFDFSPYTPMFNVTGQPAMSVPLHWNDDGVPMVRILSDASATKARSFSLRANSNARSPGRSENQPRKTAVKEQDSLGLWEITQSAGVGGMPGVDTSKMTPEQLAQIQAMMSAAGSAARPTKTCLTKEKLEKETYALIMARRVIRTASKSWRRTRRPYWMAPSSAGAANHRASCTSRPCRRRASRAASKPRTPCAAGRR